MVTTIRLHLYQKNNRGVAYGLSLVFFVVYGNKLEQGRLPFPN